MHVCVCVRACVRACVCVWVWVCPFRYKQALQWVDNMIAYYSAKTVVRHLHSCGYFPASAPSRADLLHSCNRKKASSYLCEMKISKPFRGRLGIQLSTPTNRMLNFPHVVCRSGHMTHRFMACEIQSGCWAAESFSESDKWGVPDPASCQAPMTSLPPAFTCTNGLQRLSYTLVCDHRVDCFDSSDEDFCVFPLCESTIHFKCDSTDQVFVCLSVYPNSQPLARSA